MAKSAKESAKNEGANQHIVLQIWQLSLQAWILVIQTAETTVFSIIICRTQADDVAFPDAIRHILQYQFPF